MKDCNQDRIRKISSEYFDPYYDYSICVLGLETRPIKPSKSLIEESRGATSELAKKNVGMKFLKSKIRIEVDRRKNGNKPPRFDRDNYSSFVSTSFGSQMELFSN